MATTETMFYEFKNGEEMKIIKLAIIATASWTTNPTAK